MGLGLVRDRMGKTHEALPILQQALDHYQDEYVKGFQQLDSSIIAKAPRVVTLLTGPASSADGMHVLTQAHMSIGKACVFSGTQWVAPLLSQRMRWPRSASYERRRAFRTVRKRWYC